MMMMMLMMMMMMMTMMMMMMIGIMLCLLVLVFCQPQEPRNPPRVVNGAPCSPNPLTLTTKLLDSLSLNKGFSRLKV